MRAVTREVAGPPAFQRDGYTTSSPFHSPAKAASLRGSSSGDGAARWAWAIGLSPISGPDVFLGGLAEIVSRQPVEAGLADDFLPGPDIGAPQPHHQRHL